MTLQIWDPDTAQCLRRLESTRSPVGALSCLPPPHSTAVIATTDGTLKYDFDFVPEVCGFN